MNIATPSRPWHWYFLFASLALAGLGALLHYGPGKYHHWRAAQLARQAKAFLEKKDLTSAGLTAKQGLIMDIKSVECWEVVAKIDKENGQPEEIYARSIIEDLRKGSLDAALDCAETALRFNDPASAAAALGKVGEADREDVRYQVMRGRVGAASGKLNEAVDGYARAMKLDPQDEEYPLGRAEALLSRGWIEDRTAARSTLERLVPNPKIRLHALRVLLKDSLANKEIGTALPLARELAAAPEAAFGEKVTLLDLLRQSGSQDFAPTLAALEEARGDPAKMAELELWMSRSSQFSEAIEWALHFTPEEWGDPRVCAAVAVDLFAKADWVGLELFTETGNWQGLEYFRCALHARALREQGQFLEAGQEWKASVEAATHMPRATADLADFVAGWGWNIELIDVLLVLVKDPKEAGWASRMLLPLVTRSKNTPGLWEATARYMETAEASDAAVNNFAMYSLLLRRDVSRAGELARKLYTKHPTEGDYVSTYAYSLHLLGQTQQGLEALESLGPQQLETPDVATYYGILLAAHRDWTKAPRFLDLAKGANLLPEEEVLLTSARRRVEEDRLAAESPAPAPVAKESPGDVSWLTTPRPSAPTGPAPTPPNSAPSTMEPVAKESPGDFPWLTTPRPTVKATPAPTPAIAKKKLQ